MRVTVYCASSAQVDPSYFTAAEELGRALVRGGAQTVYGGGSVGLMGRLADTIMEQGGRITGIIPQFMMDIGLHHKAVEDMICVVDMHKRKEAFLDQSDAVVALPGGCGTLEELLEVITFKKLGLFVKPIVIVNVNGFFSPLLAMLEHCIAERFMLPRHRDMWTVITDPSCIVEAIENSPPWDENAIGFAVID